MNPLQVLLFTKSTSYRHTSIPPAISSLHRLASATGLFTLTHSEDAESSITDTSLAQYSVVIFLHCTGSFLSPSQVAFLRGYVRRGGGFVGIHGAAAGMVDDEWYVALIGAAFSSHPEPQFGRVIAQSFQGEQDQEGTSHPRPHFILQGNEQVRERTWRDEWYNFQTHPRRDNPQLEILLAADTTSFRGGEMGSDHPLAWCQEFEGGRSFYTALGHFDEAYEDEWFMNQIFRSILWVAHAEDALKSS